MSTIPMLKGAGGVPQPVFLSDAAVEQAYRRVMGGIRLQSQATQSLISSFAQAGTSIAGAGLRYSQQLEANENEVAAQEYRTALSRRLADKQEEVLTGKRKSADGGEEEAIDFSTEESLRDWCESTRREFQEWHDQIITSDAVKEGAKRIGGKLKTAMTEDVERFVFSAFSQKFRENRTRARDSALADLETQEATATPAGFQAARERALALGASPDEVKAASIKGAYLKISSMLDAEAAALKSAGEQEFLLGRTDALEKAIRTCVTENLDADGDGKIDAAEAAMGDKLKLHAAQAFSAGTAEERKERRSKAIYRRMSEERELLRKAYQEKSAWAVGQIEQNVARLIDGMGSKEQAAFVQAYFDGDVPAAQKAVRLHWDEAKKEIAAAWETETKKEITARNETQCLAMAEAIGLFLSGDAEASSVLSRAGFRRKDGQAFEMKVLPDDTYVTPGSLFTIDRGEGEEPDYAQRASAQDVFRIVEACRNAYSGKSPEEITYAAAQLFSGELWFTESDYRLMSKALKGAQSATPEQREYAERLYQALSNESAALRRTEKSGEKFASRYGHDSQETADRNLKAAYFKQLEAFFDLCMKHELGLAKEGTTFRTEIEKAYPGMAEEIARGATWDRRLELIQSLNRTLGVKVPPVSSVEYRSKDF